MSSYIDPINIVFLGPSGVGKTSVLAAMAEQLKTEAERAKVKLTFKADTWPWMQEAIEELKERVFRPNMGNTPSITRTDYELELAPTVLKGWVEGLTIPIKIVDYPGEWLTSYKQGNIQKVKDMIETASIVMIAIDAVALMEARNEELNYVHERNNAAEQVTNILRETLLDRTSLDPKLVMFIPIRGEKWLQEPVNEQGALVKQVESLYADTLAMFRQSPLSQQVAVVIAPVETLGIVHFDRFGPRRTQPQLPTDAQGRDVIPTGEPSPRNYDAYYKRVGDSKIIKPKYASEILRYALSFSMILFRNRTDAEIQQVMDKAKAELLEELTQGDDPAWVKWLIKKGAAPVVNLPLWLAGEAAKTIVNWPTNQALSNFAKDRRETLPFKIVQGNHLLVPKQ